jgi:thiosulfate/3-mercaptopyruvate sulfurtransferase
MNPHPIYPHALMTTEAVAEAMHDSTYRLIEVDMDPGAYYEAHIPGAIGWDWEQQLRDRITHELLTPEEFTQLLCLSGISRETKVVLYGDNHNWFACWAYWMFYMIGHKHVWLMDGGTDKWFAEGRPVNQILPDIEPAAYGDIEFDFSNKAATEQVFEAFFSPKTHRLVDVRSQAEYQGIRRGPLGVEPRCAVAGHIPTAINIPWNVNCNADGTFKKAEDLRELYEGYDITAKNIVITYCAIGERASLSWFVLKQLLGFGIVMNYDRSMAQWSRLENAPLVQAA